MAPESLDGFLARLREQVGRGAVEVRFGLHHHSHAVCVEEGTLRVRRLEYTVEEANAYMAEHGYFMPESAEEISRPGTLVLEARTLDELEATFRGLPWPWG